MALEGLCKAWQEETGLPVARGRIVQSMDGANITFRIETIPEPVPDPFVSVLGVADHNQLAQESLKQLKFHLDFVSEACADGAAEELPLIADKYEPAPSPADLRECPRCGADPFVGELAEYLFATCSDGDCVLGKTHFVLEDWNELPRKEPATLPDGAQSGSRRDRPCPTESP
jgi:hypothetical protein